MTILNRKHYGYYRNECGCDDLYLICDRKGTVVKVIVFWDDDPKWQERANQKAVRVCRWLNRTAPLRIRLDRMLKRFDPTGNHEQFHDMRTIANHLEGDREDHDAASE